VNEFAEKTAKAEQDRLAKDAAEAKKKAPKDKKKEKKKEDEEEDWWIFWMF